MLAACRGAAQAASINNQRLIYPYIEEEMKLATPIPLQRLCELGQASRAGFYRWRHAPPAVDADLDLRDEIQRIALEWPCYGWRRITEELHRRDWPVNHKRVLRIMREDNLLCLRRRKFVVTTDSNHDRPVYPNLASDMVLKLTPTTKTAPTRYGLIQASRRERCEGEGRKKDLRTPLPDLLPQGDTATELNASGIKTGELIGESRLYPC
jgi:hypothetical protein